MPRDFFKTLALFFEGVSKMLLKVILAPFFLLIAILFVLFVINRRKLKEKTESEKSLNEFISGLGIVLEGEKLGIAIWIDNELVYINSILLEHTALAGIEIRDKKELDELFSHPEKYLVFYDMINEIKKQREAKVSEYSRVWRKEVGQKYFEIKYFRKHLNGKEYVVLTTRDVSNELSNLEVTILAELSEIFSEHFSRETINLYEVGEDIKRILANHGLVDIIGIGILKPTGELYFPYFKYTDEDDRSGFVVKPEEKTLSRYIVDKGLKVHIRNSEKDNSLSDGYDFYYIRRFTTKVFTIYGVPVSFRGLIKGVILFEKQGEDQFSKSTIAIFDKIAHFISLALRFIEILDELNTERTKLFELSIKDYLTGAYSRRFLEQFLEKELNKCRRTNAKATVVFLDINEFKKINDTYGHVYGDEVLKTLVETICKNIRTMDVVARYGGDEFVLVLPETGVENAERVMKRIVEALKEKNISISYGMLEISEFETIGDVYKEVDKRMYGMKKSKTSNT